MSKEKTYKVQKLFDWYKKFENMDIKIQGNTKEFDIEIRDKYLPHLLGLQYINSNDNNIKGKRLYSYVKDNNLSDQEILSRVEQNYGPGKREDVSNRIKTFPNFLKNLENGIIVEKTLPTKMNVNYLIIQNKENNFYHLGILSGSNGALLVDFENIEDKREKDFLKTYFVESNNEYFKNSNIVELVKSIERYDEKEKQYIPFSFDEEKNKKLLQQYYSEKKKLKNLLEERIEKGISRGNYNALTGNEIIVPIHESNDKRWIRVDDVEKNNIKVNGNEKPILAILTGKNEKGNLKLTSVEFYNVSQLQITKEIEQKFVPMKQKEQEKIVEKVKDKGMGIED